MLERLSQEMLYLLVNISNMYFQSITLLSCQAAGQAQLRQLNELTGDCSHRYLRSAAEFRFRCRAACC